MPAIPALPWWKCAKAQATHKWWGEWREIARKKVSLVRINTSFNTLERVQVLCIRKGQEVERPRKMGEHRGQCKGSENIRREEFLVTGPWKETLGRGRDYLIRMFRWNKYSSVLSPISQELFNTKFFIVNASTVLRLVLGGQWNSNKLYLETKLP